MKNARMQYSLELASLLAFIAVTAVASSSLADDAEEGPQPGDGPRLSDRNLFAQAEGHAAVFSDDPSANIISGGLGYALRAGWRFDRFGVFAQAGQAAWWATGVRRDISPGVFNIGGGAEFRFFNGRVRSSAAAGSSTLLYSTALDTAGTTGWFANIRPAGFRWSVSEHFVVELNPISFMVMQPVTRKERLTKVEYQSVFALEFQ